MLHCVNVSLSRETLLDGVSLYASFDSRTVLHVSKLGPYSVEESGFWGIGQKYVRKMTGDKEHAYSWHLKIRIGDSVVLVYVFQRLKTYSHKFEVQSNLSNSKLKGPQKKRIIQEFELWKLCSKYIIIKGPIKNFELYKFELDKFRCIWKYRNVPLFYVIIKWQRCVAGVSVNCDFVYPSVSYSTIPSSSFFFIPLLHPPFSAPDCLAGCLPSLDRISSNTARR